MTRPQAEINAEIERMRPVYEARARRIRRMFAAFDEITKRDREGNADMRVESGRSAQFLDGRRHAIKWAIQYLHDRAKGMNDPNAKAVLNSAAFHVGTDAKRSLALPADLVACGESEYALDPRAATIGTDVSFAAIEAAELADDLAVIAQLSADSAKKDATIASLAADRDRHRTFVRTARAIIQAYASEHPTHVWQGSYQDPMGAHTWLSAEPSEAGTMRDGRT